MATYSRTKSSLLQRAGAPSQAVLKGVALDGGGSDGWQPIRPCICVTEPCPCDSLEDLILWVPSSKQGQETRQRSGQDPIVAYPVDPDEQVLVELQIPMTMAQLKQLKEWAQREEATDSDSSPRAARSGKKKPVGTAGAAVAAFEVGYALGTKIDEATGLSDKISDWASENIPWPF